MIRELAIGSVIGSFGLGTLVLGAQGYLNPESPLLTMFGDPDIALAAVAVGLICCMIEIRIMVPALRSIARQRSGG
jgi:hypothetical protein